MNKLEGNSYVLRFILRTIVFLVFLISSATAQNIKLDFYKPKHVKHKNGMWPCSSVDSSTLIINFEMGFDKDSLMITKNDEIILIH